MISLLSTFGIVSLLSVDICFAIPATKLDHGTANPSGITQLSSVLPGFGSGGAPSNEPINKMFSSPPNSSPLLHIASLTEKFKDQMNAAAQIPNISPIKNFQALPFANIISPSAIQGMSQVLNPANATNNQAGTLPNLNFHQVIKPSSNNNSVSTTPAPGTTPAAQLFAPINNGNSAFLNQPLNGSPSPFTNQNFLVATLTASNSTNGTAPITSTPISSSTAAPSNASTPPVPTTAAPAVASTSIGSSNSTSTAATPTIPTSTLANSANASQNAVPIVLSVAPVVTATNSTPPNAGTVAVNLTPTNPTGAGQPIITPPANSTSKP